MAYTITINSNSPQALAFVKEAKKLNFAVVTKTFDDPKENFVYPSKNRYNALPLSELKYSVFYQQLLHDEEQEQPVTDLIFDVVY